MSRKSKVAVVMGSDSDLGVMQDCVEALRDFNIFCEVRILSAHRCPEELVEYVKSLSKKGVQVVIAAAGGAAHLPGVIAAHTDLPVIGVPMETKYLKGIDSLFSIVQMPKGVPVATMSIGEAGAKNAAVFAAEILGLKDKKVSGLLAGFKKEQKQSALKKDKDLRRS